RADLQRIGNSQIDHYTASAESLGQILPAEADLAQLGARWQNGDDRVAGLCHHLGRADCEPAVIIGELAGRDVVYIIELECVIAAPEETQGDTGAEGADADHTNGQLRHLASF